MKFSLPKILLPLDFSKKDINAARYAIQLAEAFEARITLLHVLTQHHGFDMPGFENEELSGFLSENENNAQKQLDAFLTIPPEAAVRMKPLLKRRLSSRSSRRRIPMQPSFAPSMNTPSRR
jgi:hypothetical protein